MTSSFDVHLSDAAISHHVYLTHADLRQLSFSYNDDDDKRSEAIVFDRRVSASTSSSWDHTLLFSVVAVAVIALSLLSAFIRADRHTNAARWVAVKILPPAVNECRPSTSRAVCTYQLYSNGHIGRSTSVFCNVPYSYCYHNGRSYRVISTKRYRLLVGIYATLWVVTGLLTTFNVFFYVVSVLVDPDWRYVAAITRDGHADMSHFRRTVETNFSQFVVGHQHDELRRYRNAVVERVHACRNHVDNTIHRTSAILATQSAAVSDIGWWIAAQTAERHVSRLTTYDVRIDAFTDAFESKLTAAVGRSLRRHRTYVNSLISNAWLRFAADIYNSTHQAPPPANLGIEAVAGFGNFLDVDELKQVEAWVLRFWQRYDLRYTLLYQVILCTFLAHLTSRLGHVF